MKVLAPLKFLLAKQTKRVLPAQSLSAVQLCLGVILRSYDWKIVARDVFVSTSALSLELMDALLRMAVQSLSFANPWALKTVVVLTLRRVVAVRRAVNGNSLRTVAPQLARLTPPQTAVDPTAVVELKRDVRVLAPLIVKPIA